MSSAAISEERRERMMTRVSDGKSVRSERPAPWDEAEVVANPVKKGDEPMVLVKRRTSLLLGSRDEELIMLPGPSMISLFTGMAMAAMAGAIAKRDENGIIANSPQDVAEVAITYADCLIDELARH